MTASIAWLWVLRTNAAVAVALGFYVILCVHTGRRSLRSEPAALTRGDVVRGFLSPCVTILCILISSRIGARKEIDRSFLFLLGLAFLIAAVATCAYRMKYPVQPASSLPEENARDA